MNRIKFENVVYEVARAWGFNDKDIALEYELLEDFDEISILLRLFIPRREDFAWIDFWGDVSKHVSKAFDIVVFVEHKRETE